MSLSCAELSTATAEILGGEGTDDLREALGRHLAGCAACAHAHAGLEELLDRARLVDIPEPSAAYWSSFIPDLRQRLEPPAKANRWLPDGFGLSLSDWLRPGLATASLLLVLAAALRPVTPTTTVEVASIQGDEELYEFAEAMDLLTPFDPLSGWDVDVELENQFDDGATGDLFAFLESAVDLGPDETERLLGDLDDQFAG